MVEDVGTEPRLAGRRLALEGERPPVAERCALGNQPRGLEERVAVRVAGLEDPRGKRVRGEDDVRRAITRRDADAIGQELHEPFVRPPLADEPRLDATRDGCVEQLLVLCDRERRPMRGEDEADERVVAELERRLDGACDPRLPVAHARQHADPERLLEGSACLFRHGVERRRPVRVVDPERGVTRDEVVEQLRPDRSAAADVRIVGGHVGEPVGRSVRHQDDGGARHAAIAASVRSWTSSTSRVSDVRVRLREHAVAEVEDVARAPVRARQDVERLALDDVPGGRERRRIEVALHGAVPDEAPSLVEREAPVEADHVAACGGEAAEEVGGAGSEVDRRDVDGAEDPCAPRRDARLVLCGREGPDPGVEELHDVSAGHDLRRDVRGEDVREPLHQGVPGLRLREHQRLRAWQLAARPALDEIPGDGERAAAESDHGLLRGKLRPDEPDRLEHRREGLLDVRHVEPLDVCGAPDRPVDDRADALDELDVEPHPDDRGHDVREHDGRVDAVAPHRLERHLGAELGLARDLEEGVALADHAVLRQRSPRLAHEPDGRAFDALAPRGADEKRIGHPWSVAPDGPD